MSSDNDPDRDSARDHANESIDGRIERAKDRALGPHDSDPSVGDEVGEAAGGISGVLVGAGIGSVGGPVGTLIGGIAGALGGWWAGRAVAEAAGTLSSEDEAYYRSHYESTPGLADRSYDQARGAYYLGHIAANNPNFTAREFSEVEPELERGWSGYGDKQGTWVAVRAYAQEGFNRGRSRLDESARRARRENSLGDEPDRRE